MNNVRRISLIIPSFLLGCVAMKSYLQRPIIEESKILQPLIKSIALATCNTNVIINRNALINADVIYKSASADDCNTGEAYKLYARCFTQTENEVVSFKDIPLSYDSRVCDEKSELIGLFGEKAEEHEK